MDGRIRNDIRIGERVKIVLKADQQSGKLTEGTVQEILTKSSAHPNGIKVRLLGGQVGRVKEIIR
ncbi:MAG: YwbE family protein [Syntrophaceae bacterium]